MEVCYDIDVERVDLLSDEIIESSLVSSAPGGSSGGNRDKDTKDNNNNTAASNNETNGRSAALERAYVHDVYESCEEPVGGIRPKVAQFLSSLEPGSLVCDVGCGNGRYLTAGCNPAIHSIGVDRCCRLTKVARNSGAEVRKTLKAINEREKNEISFRASQINDCVGSNKRFSLSLSHTQTHRSLYVII
jgi:SAM-dependent methyltransferase